MDLINGAVLKSRSYGRDARVNKYDVLEACYFHLRANLDHRNFIELNSYLREYPFDIKISACSRGLYYLWLEYNFHGKDSNWKLHQIYPHSFVRNKIDFKIEFDANGVSKIIVSDPPQAALEDLRNFTFARFKIRRRKKILPPLPPPPRFKATGKRMNRVSKTPKNYRQRRVYQHRKKLSTPPPPPPPMIREEKEKKIIDPKKPKRKIDDPKIKQNLRTTAERMNKWQTRKFLME
uniref:Uncharacterized protein n=1 Tax=Panagrolaimus sp. JU765 TaxID=591449 RepID=A0AC34PW50_9BILA